LNLKRKVCFKKSLKKKKKKKDYPLTFRPSWACRPTKPPRSGPPNRLLFFFLADADTWPRLSASPSPLPFFFPTLLQADPAPPRESCHALPLPFPPSSPNRPIKAINPSLDQLEPLPSFSTEP
jgi:hypothetical protein